MEAEGHLNVKNCYHIETLRLCFGPIIQLYIEEIKHEWNEHRIRPQKFRQVDGGTPNSRYDCPEMYGCADHKKTVNLEHVNILLKDHLNRVEPRLVSVTFLEMVKIVYPSFCTPKTSEEAYVEYFKVLSLLRHVINV